MWLQNSHVINDMHLMGGVSFCKIFPLKDKVGIQAPYGIAHAQWIYLGTRLCSLIHSTMKNEYITRNAVQLTQFRGYAGFFRVAL